MAPKRDAFALVLGALRDRLRQGVDAPGDALPINLIAADLRLSSTPVREALSRLAGEHLVDKRGATYTRPRLDGPRLAALYNLRLTYLSAALAPDVTRRITSRPGPVRAPFDFARDLALGAHPAALAQALFLELICQADDPILKQAYHHAADRLAPFQALEDQVLGDVARETLSLIAAFEARRPAQLRAAVRHHHRRRMAQAHALARLADDPKYRTNIV